MVSQAIGMTKAGAPASPVVIIGPRGMGKTVLLRRASAEARADGGIVISAEASRQEPLTISLRDGLERAQSTIASLPDRLRQTMGKVVKAIALSGAGQDGAPKRFPVLLRELNDQARKHARYLLFAIDEIQESSVADLTDLVIFVHETAGTSNSALLIGAGLQNARGHLHDVRTYTERWDYLEIGLLDERQTQDALSKPIHDAKHRIEQRALESLANESGGYPFFVQEYGSAAWAQHSGKTIELADVRRSSRVFGSNWKPAYMMRSSRA